MGEVWKRLDEEPKGVSPGKIWLANVNSGESALFKPDTDEKESAREFKAAKIAEELGIPCAKIRIMELCGERGTLSYNFKTIKNVRYFPAGYFYDNNGKYSGYSHDKGGRSLALTDELSMQDLRTRPELKSLEKGAVDMLFLDCLIRNTDRHGENWEIIQDIETGEVLGVAPLFDHGLSFEPSPKLAYIKDNSQFCWVSGEEISHYEMFAKLSEHYPEQVKDLLDRTEKADGKGVLGGFAKERFEKMKEIFENVNKKKEILESEKKSRNSTRLKR